MQVSAPRCPRWIVSLLCLVSLVVAGSSRALAANDGTLTIHGKVVNGTAGFKVPAATQLILRVLDTSQGTPRDLQQFTTQTGDNGSFSFMEIPRQNGSYYVVTTQYSGLLQTSDQIQLQPSDGSNFA